MVSTSSASSPPFFADMQEGVEEVLVLLHNILGELQSPLLKNIETRLQNESEQIYLKLHLRLEKLLAERTKKTKNIAKKVGRKTVRRWEKEIYGSNY